MTVSAHQTHLEAEITAQPGDWIRAAASIASHRPLLPADGERVAVIGCGTSLYMAEAYASLREESGHGITDAWTPTEARLDRAYDRVLAITRSGTTTEIIDLLSSIRGTTAATVITATPGSPVVDLADAIVTPEFDEQSVVQTRFATSTLALLRAQLGHDLTRAVEQARAALDAEPPHWSTLSDAEQFTFVGRGWTNGLAHEAALKLREAAQQWTEAYPMMEYRHGPLSVSAPGRVVWAFGEPVEGFAEDVATTGAHFQTSTDDPMAELVKVHRLSLEIALRRGLDPDHPRNLSRSVVLDS
ncbi:sugar isomerase [Aeromicrobium sp. PE09-221]|uniref:SIS domain-containing protein n=1 Tax=Aeromicrobium sp. PE09-221 TaxID=1898043 RepID=UPI000B3E88EE|nr:sugar isomerase [Aeromicrobium sp. PE09-221]OUZ11967.1 sugar isomerase [Aeromicrobium sp. PE09-221]